MTAAEAGPPRNLSAASSALIIVDLQHDFCHADGLVGRQVEPAVVDAVCSSIDRLYAAARRDGVPVVFVQTIHRPATDSRAWRNRFRPDGLAVCRVGTLGADFHHRRPAVEDIVVRKHRYSAFHGTELEHVLHALGRSTVVLVGTATNVGVESTARDACMLDYEVVVIDDATFAVTPAEHLSALTNVSRYFGEVADTAAVAAAWDASAPRFPTPGDPFDATIRPGWQNPFHRERR